MNRRFYNCKQESIS